MTTRTAVVIGRFQPYHNGHKAIVDRTLQDFDHTIVLVGSANQPRSRKNPWTWTERADMIIAAHPLDEHRIYVVPLLDFPADDKQWAENVAGLVHSTAPPESKITLVGHRKDESTFYLDLFPQWELLELESTGYRDGTAIRKDYFNSSGSFEAKVEKDVPVSTLARMQQFLDSRALEGLKS